MGRRSRGGRGAWTIGAALLIALSGGASFGCSSSDAEPPSSVCERFVSSYCAKAVSCAQETDRSDFSELCDFSFRVYLPCEQVTRVWRDSQPCESALAAIRCTDVEPGSFPQSPEACQGLFGIE